MSLPAVVTLFDLSSGAILPAICGTVCRWEIFFRTGSIIFGGGQVGAASLIDCACTAGTELAAWRPAWTMRAEVAGPKAALVPLPSIRHYRGGLVSDSLDRWKPLHGHQDRRLANPTLMHTQHLRFSSLPPPALQLLCTCCALAVHGAKKNMLSTG